MRTIKPTWIVVSLTWLCAALAMAPTTRAAEGQPVDTSDAQTAADKQGQTQAQAQARPEIEKQRQGAQQQAQQSLDKDAIEAIKETQNALKAIADGKKDDALAAIERATGKINVLTARSPATALLPVSAEVDIIDTAPTDRAQIRRIAKAADDAIDVRDYPAARVLLAELTSEIRVRTYNLPLVSYPVALREAARLIDQNKMDEARVVLETALNTLAVVDRGIPIPLAVAQAAIDEAQQLRDKDKDNAQKLLTVARTELERARELGYAGKDPEYQALNQAISDVEKQLKGGQDSGGTFSRLKDRLASFFKRQSSTEKNSQVASSK
jgi:hypothetical protein